MLLYFGGGRLCKELKRWSSDTSAHVWPSGFDPMVTIKLWEMPFLPPI